MKYRVTLTLAGADLVLTACEWDRAACSESALTAQVIEDLFTPPAEATEEEYEPES